MMGICGTSLLYSMLTYPERVQDAFLLAADCNCLNTAWRTLFLMRSTSLVLIEQNFAFSIRRNMFHFLSKLLFHLDASAWILLDHAICISQHPPVG
jgi:hypothetical protein